MDGPHLTRDYGGGRGGWVPGNEARAPECHSRYGRDAVTYRGGAACAAAAGGGHIVILEWLREKGAKWDPRSCAEAAMRGHLDCLRWLIENECPQDGTTFYWGVKWGATSGCKALLEYLVEQGCPWGTSPWASGYAFEVDTVWQVAAEEGSEEMVQWLHETEIKQSVPWTIETCYAAAKAGRLDILRLFCRLFHEQMAEEHHVYSQHQFIPEKRPGVMWIRASGDSMDE